MISQCEIGSKQVKYTFFGVYYAQIIAIIIY